MHAYSNSKAHAQCLLAVPFLLFGSWWICQRAMEMRSVLAQFEQAVVVDGTVTYSYDSRDDSEPPSSDYEFTTVAGKKVNGTGQFYEPVGSIIDIEYIPKNPQLNRIKGDVVVEGDVRASYLISYLIAVVLACIGLWAIGESIYVFARNKQPSEWQVIVLQGTIWLVVIVACLKAFWWFQDHVWRPPDGLLVYPFIVIGIAISFHLGTLLIRVITPKPRLEQS